MYKNDRVTRRYTKPFKLKILDELSTGRYTKNQLGKIYGINPSTINEWIKKYEHNDLMSTRVMEETKENNKMNRKIFEPQENLKEWVKCYWNLESDFKTTPIRNTIIPDGTMKLIFHYGDTYKHHPNDIESIILPKCFLIGQLTKPYIVEPLGTTGSFVVRFQPNGFLPFANISIKEIQNTAVPLNKLFGKDGDEIGKQILNANSTSERIAIIETFLLERLTEKKNIDSIVKSTIDTIIEANGQFSVNELSEQNNINRRQLTRKFSSTIGLSPKQLSKTIRIQNALKSLLNKEVTSLTDLAYENEYFDQAHFIKDFKEFTGLTPKEFYGNNLKMSLIFDSKD